MTCVSSESRGRQHGRADARAASRAGGFKSFRAGQRGVAPPAKNAEIEEARRVHAAARLNAERAVAAGVRCLRRVLCASFALRPRGDSYSSASVFAVVMTCSIASRAARKALSLIRTSSRVAIGCRPDAGCWPRPG